LSLAAARATLGEVLTDEAYARMIPLAERYTAGVQDVLDSRRMPWNVVQIGARAEYRFTPVPPRTGGEAAAAHDGELDAYMHVHLINRGVLITPFHNMALISPATTAADVDRHSEAFAEAVDDLLGDG
jgi:glutamate-1-semialdehyde 2,1-aminomutase